ncbi:MAG: gliding motility-associated C-terminal domain-containing protein [Vicingaceae bacterium]
MAVSAFSQTPPPQSPLFYNNGEVYIDSGVPVQIYGNTITTGLGSILHNDGEIYVHFDSIFLSAVEGFTIDNFSVVEGNGYYEIEPDWRNNSPNFIPDESHVHLMSDVQQLITGTEITDFFDLEISGNGIGNDRKKRMTIDANVQDSLSLQDRELATDSFTLTIQNTATNAISRNSAANQEGFVSSLKGDNISGSLVRRTANSSAPYFFPVGSSVNPPSSLPYIFRPVDLLPASTNINSYSVRFVHESPDLEGFGQFSLDDSLCTVNPLYYHMINRTSGFDSARIRLYYDPLQDDIYDNSAQWSNGKWNLIKSSQYNDKGTFFQVTIPQYAFFSRDSLPFILADRIPNVARIVGNPDICSNDLAMLRAIGNANFYDWTVPGDIEILSAPQDDSLIMKVFQTGGYVQLSSTSSTGKCVEAADSFLIVVHPGPTANFTVSDIRTFTNQVIEFRDSTTGSPIDWFWKFGDGKTAFSPITRHKFGQVGEFVVEMYVQDENGCLDSAFVLIEIIEGISVPNIFTPNGDGNNDLFYIPNSGLKDYRFEVFNRWGNIIFETTATEIAWDGYNTFGKPVPEGTYYYVLVARSDKNEYVRKGFLSLIR